MPLAHQPRVASLLATFALVATAITTSAQTVVPPKPWPEPSFPKLFAKYTGQNGYEDLVLAGDILTASQAVQTVEQLELNPTLKQLRTLLEDQEVERALQMVRAGLDKPIRYPRDPDKFDGLTLLPEYAGFRRLARIMALQEYVELADGRMSSAIDTMREGLRLGYVVQGESLISGLVGTSIDAVALVTVARHFDQMALRDCIQVTRIAQEWLKLPSPVENLYNFEHRSLMNTLRACREDPSRLRELVQIPETRDPPTSDGEMAAFELADYVERNPTRLAALLDATAGLADVEHAALIQEVRKPAWQRKQTSKASPRIDMAHRLYAALASYNDQALPRFERDRVQIQLLGVHGAIRRFRWENNRLPDALDQLKLPSLTTDPFTGAPLIYKPAGDHYELYSAGAAGENATGPIYLPHRKQ